MKYRSGACHTEGNEGLLAVDSHGVTSHIRGSREESSEQQAHRTEAFSLGSSFDAWTRRDRVPICGICLALLLLINVPTFERTLATNDD